MIVSLFRRLHNSKQKIRTNNGKMDLIDANILDDPTVSIEGLIGLLKDIVPKVNSLASSFGKVREQLDEALNCFRLKTQDLHDIVICQVEEIFNKMFLIVDSHYKLVQEPRTNDLMSRIENIETKQRHLTPMPPGFPTSSDLTNCDRLTSIEENLDSRMILERRNEIIISNVIVNSRASFDTHSFVQRVCSFFTLSVHPDDVVSCKLINHRTVSQQKRAAILVKFRDVQIKTSLMQAYLVTKNLSNRDLQTSNINLRVFINDNLTPKNAAIFKKAKNLFKQSNLSHPKLVQSIVISDGRTRITKTDGSSLIITSLEQLYVLFNEISDIPTNSA